jgi:hypothetical protein
MNERIKQLAVQAGFDAVSMVAFDIKEDLEKFAQLIVRECAEVARSNTRVDSKVYLMIQEHFGVE